MQTKILGMRTIKTGIAVMMSVIVSNLIGLEYPFFVAMTAIISMDKTALTSIKMGKNRVLGTFIGAVLGVCFSYIQAGNPILCGLGIILLILICNKLNAQGSITVGGIVFMAIMVHIGDKSPIFYGFHRTFDSLVGAIVSLCVNLIILPNYNVKKLESMVCEMVYDVALELRSLSETRKADTATLMNELKRVEIEIALYENEFMSAYKKELVRSLKTHYEKMIRIMFEINVCTQDNEDDTVFNYHLNKAERLYEEFQNSLK